MAGTIWLHYKISIFAHTHAHTHTKGEGNCYNQIISLVFLVQAHSANIGRKITDLLRFLLIDSKINTKASHRHTDIHRHSDPLLNME